MTDKDLIHLAKINTLEQAIQKLDIPSCKTAVTKLKQQLTTELMRWELGR